MFRFLFFSFVRQKILFDVLLASRGKMKVTADANASSAIPYAEQQKAANDPTSIVVRNSKALAINTKKEK